MVFDALAMSYRRVKIRKDPNCALCGSISHDAAEAAMDSTISVRDLKTMLDAHELGEDDFVQIPGAILIPKGEFMNGSALAVVKGAGFSDAVHVGGGVLAWVNQIEPNKPTY